MKRNWILWAIFILAGTIQAQVGTIFEKEGLIFEVKSIIPYHVEVKENAYPNAEHVDIPYNVSHGLFNYMVESVGPRSFEFDDLKSVQVTHSVNWLKEACFRKTKLQRFDCPDELYDIFDLAFDSCFELDSVFTNRMLKRVHDYAFNDCHKLRFIEFPATLEYIGSYAFKECGFERLTLPNVPFAMYEGAFSNCEKLLSLDLGTGITDIPSRAFENAPLPEIIIPDQVKTIGYAAFKRTTSQHPRWLICIGSDVTDIAMYAFMTVYGQVTKHIICKAITPPKCDALAFEETTYKYGTLYVPKESIEAYQEAATWKMFKNIEEYDSTLIDRIPKVETDIMRPLEIYNLSGQRTTRPMRGINILDNKKVLMK